MYNISYWGDPERFKFKALIDSFTSITEVNAGENRTVRANFDLTLKGYLIPNVIQKDLIAPKKVLSPSRITFDTEIIASEFPQSYAADPLPPETPKPPNPTPTGRSGVTYAWKDKSHKVLGMLSYIIGGLAICSVVNGPWGKGNLGGQAGQRAVTAMILAGQAAVVVPSLAP